MTLENIKPQAPIVLKKALSAEACALLSNYVRFKAKVNPNIKNDRLKNVHREYGDMLMDMYLDQLTPLIEEATQSSLWPTHSFYYQYTNGTKLVKHKDRSSCQIVAGLYIDADEDFKKDNKHWPLFLNVQGKTEAFPLDVGDLVIFRGFETEHWREAFTGNWFISAIFAYVEKDSPYAFQKFDQRSSLGKPHVGMFRWMWGCVKNGMKPE